MFPNTVERISFDNGYGISVVNGLGTYSDYDTFEVAVITPAGDVKEPEGYVSISRLEEIKEEVKKYESTRNDVE